MVNIYYFTLDIYLIYYYYFFFIYKGIANVPANRKPNFVSKILSVVEPAHQANIQIAPQIFVPNISAGTSNVKSINSQSDDEICMAVLDEFQNQDLADTI
jgi:glycosylphosphatidylinositol transamidase (GPIT) subunit GPI8